MKIKLIDIFRPFIGYREVKLIKKRSRFNDEEIYLCFVNFDDEITAAVCL
jgi:hypothetical protein